MQALAAAFLFRASALRAKLLLSGIEPILLAGLLYLGSGIGLLLLRTVRKSTGGVAEAEAKLSRADIPWLAAAILSGGVAAPIILLFSLQGTPAATASHCCSTSECAATDADRRDPLPGVHRPTHLGAILCITCAASCSRRTSAAHGSSPSARSES
ncbi:MAG: EamA family transporter [Desulfobacterales bacterium]|nr:EamA family transporter [Desulfobacterales bacterium]